MAIETGESWKKLSLRFPFQCGLISLYSILLITTLALTVRWVSWTDYSPKCIIWKSISVSIMGCSIFYLRKLYKATIGSHFHSKQDDEFSTSSEFGTLAYYCLRPVFASAFSVIFYFLVTGQLIFIAEKLPSDPSRMAQFIITSSFFIGFSTGKMIGKIRDFSTQQVDNIDGPSSTT